MAGRPGSSTSPLESALAAEPVAPPRSYPLAKDAAVEALNALQQVTGRRASWLTDRAQDEPRASRDALAPRVGERYLFRPEVHE